MKLTKWGSKPSYLLYALASWLDYEPICYRIDQLRWKLEKLNW